MNPPGRTSTTMRPLRFGALVGITPWLATGVNPFFCFGLNQWLQYKGVGRWVDYAFGEKTYLVLSLGAKSLLAWQVFAVSLAA